MEWGSEAVRQFARPTPCSTFTASFPLCLNPLAHCLNASLAN